MSAEIDQLVDRLETISEELADLALARLRDAVDAGGNEVPMDEKLLTRARRAVEKAIHILKEAEGHEAAEPDFDAP